MYDNIVETMARAVCAFHGLDPDKPALPTREPRWKYYANEQAAVWDAISDLVEHKEQAE